MSATFTPEQQTRLATFKTMDRAARKAMIAERENKKGGKK